MLLKKEIEGKFLIFFSILKLQLRLHFQPKMGKIWINVHEKQVLFDFLCILGCRLRIRNRFLAVGIGKLIFFTDL